MSTIKVLELLIKEFPRENLKLRQVFALHNAQACLDTHRKKLEERRRKLNSKARLTDRDS
jgi:hypothetical protein